MLETIVWGPALNLIGFSFSMVFVLLVFIILVLNLFGIFFKSVEQKAKQNVVRAEPQRRVKQQSAKNEMDADTYVAISMALYELHKEEHDLESNILTMEKVGKRYTPWSSKIYGLNIFGKR